MNYTYWHVKSIKYIERGWLQSDNTLSAFLIIQGRIRQQYSFFKISPLLRIILSETLSYLLPVEPEGFGQLQEDGDTVSWAQFNPLILGL